MTTDNPLLNDLCRRLVEGTLTPCASPVRESATSDDDDDDDDDCNEDVSWITDDGVVCLKTVPLGDYSREELTMLSDSLGRCTAIGCLEIEAVNGLDWNRIVGHERCTLRELIVTVRSQSVLGVLASALCRNTSLVRLELDYVERDQTLSNNGDSKEVGGLVDMTDVYSSINHNLLLEAIKPLEHVIIRGISPQPLPASSHCHTKSCSWQRLTLENCDATHVTTSWIQPAIGSLQRLQITNCKMSPKTMENLSEAYLEYSAERTREKKRTNRIHKAPLRVLNLSSNIWGNHNESNGDKQEKFNGEGCDVGVYSLPALSCMASLASWMDSLSNLIELNLSNNPRLFSSSEGSVNMASLCGTVNQSLKRLSLRHCGLRSNDLSLLVSTFCWIEGLDLSENSELLENMLSLINLEHLHELVLENMSENGLCGNARNSSQGIGFLLRAIHREESRQRSKNRGGKSKRRRMLTRLNLSGNTLDDEALQAIASLVSLKVVILVGCQLESTSLNKLLERGDTKTGTFAWEELYLQSNNIGDSGAQALADNLKNGRLSALRVLHLESNVFTMNAINRLIQDGLAYSRRLISMTLWPLGAVTSNQKSAWNEAEKRMEHYLMLNQAGREVLFLDYSKKIESDEDDRDKKAISNALWPFILDGADQVYGTNALYYFLRKRPDIVSSSGKAEQKADPEKLRAPVQSPKSVMDLASLFGSV